MAFLYKGQLCKFALHLVDFPRKKYFYFQTRCYLFTHHASERSLYSFGNGNNNNNQTHSNSYYYWLSNYYVLHVTVCFIIPYIMIIVILSHILCHLIFTANLRGTIISTLKMRNSKFRELSHLPRITQLSRDWGRAIPQPDSRVCTTDLMSLIEIKRMKTYLSVCIIKYD